jgi:hypothetical protein
MLNQSNQNERGQNLIIFAILMIVLVALAGLVIDGGFALAKRREAQNAADAGALAGADALCAGNPVSAETQARDYAINRNGATTADVTLSTKVITVTTTIPHQTFLAAIFGTDVVTTTATASAGCYVPCSGVGVLPVAWACQPPAGNPGDPKTCGIQYGTIDHPGPTYIIMDSKKVDEDFYCQDPPNSGLPADALDCDLNNDGINDLFGAAGNRGWLNLDGGSASASELRDWVLNGYQAELMVHTWFKGSNGDKTVVFKAVQSITPSVVLLPVFDAYCPDVPNTTPACAGSYHTKPPDPWQDTIVLGNGGGFYYHVISFSAFKITCVSTKKQEYCPGKAAAISANPQIPDNMKSIEGYFIKDYFGSGKCDGPSAGVYTIYLNH